MTQEIEIGRSKRGRRVYAFDDIAIVPSRRTRDPEDVSVGWSIDAYQFDIPFLAAPMDSVVSPRTAIMMGQLGGLGVLDLEGLWTRYEDPEPVLAEIRSLSDADATDRMQQLYSEPIKPDLVTARLAEIRAAGVTVAGALSPQRTQELYTTVVAAGVDLPGGADLLGVAGAPRGHDRDVVEGVRAATALGTADLDLAHAGSPRRCSAEERSGGGEERRGVFMRGSLLASRRSGRAPTRPDLLDP